MQLSPKSVALVHVAKVTPPLGSSLPPLSRMPSGSGDSGVPFSEVLKLVTPRLSLGMRIRRVLDGLSQRQLVAVLVFLVAALLVGGALVGALGPMVVVLLAGPIDVDIDVLDTE